MNKKTRSQIIKALLLVIFLVSAAGVGSALMQDREDGVTAAAPDIEYEWTAPTTGAPVEYYVAEVLVNRADTLQFNNILDESLLIPAKYGNDYMIRVAGVDGDGIQGPWSAWSMPFQQELAAPGF